MESPNHKIIITDNGQQIPVQAAPGITISVVLQGDTVKEEIPVAVSEVEFADMQKQALTNKIPNAILRKRRLKQ